MKKLFVLMTLMALVLALPLSASADLIYEPRDDFFEQHMWECNYVNRKYVSNGPDGELTLYKSPENCLIQGVVPNRQSIYISYTYTAPDGIDWGCVNLWEEDIIGWVPMPYVVPIYNDTDFQEEFQDRLEEKPGDLSAFAGQDIRFWEYPGSEEFSTDKVDSDAQYAPQYDYVFVDDAGQKWGSIWYYHGIRNSWVCLDNPTADYDTLYANHAPQQVSKPEIQPEPETEPDTQPTTQPNTQPETQPTTQLVTQPETQQVTSDKVITPSGISPTTILIMAAAVAAISAGLLVVLKKKKT